jgi:hypothetical protein
MICVWTPGRRLRRPDAVAVGPANRLQRQGLTEGSRLGFIWVTASPG